jgi:hypothetical protein
VKKPNLNCFLSPRQLLASLFSGILLCAAAPGFAAEAPRVDFSGVWMPTQIAPDGSKNKIFPDVLPFRDEVRKQYEDYLAHYNPVVDDESRNCLPYGMPRQMVVVAQYPTEFIQTGDRLTLISELHNDVRRIYLRNPAVPQGLLATWPGYSTGHWEGNALVVTTTHVHAQGFPRPQSSSMTITERFRLVEGGKAGKMIELTITLDDPLPYTQAFTVKTYFRQHEHLEMGEYFCSEDLWRQNLDGRSDNIPWR